MKVQPPFLITTVTLIAQLGSLPGHADSHNDRLSPSSGVLVKVRLPAIVLARMDGISDTATAKTKTSLRIRVLFRIDSSGKTKKSLHATISRHICAVPLMYGNPVFLPRIVDFVEKALSQQRRLYAPVDCPALARLTRSNLPRPLPTQSTSTSWGLHCDR